MALEISSRLGPYSVTVLIGEGGMGQVYQLNDLTVSIPTLVLWSATDSTNDRSDPSQLQEV
jgi:hypothetical protein